jgi:hypothetical protein
VAKNFPDPKNLFKWFIIHAEIDSQTSKPTGENVTSFYRYEVDFERGQERLGSAIISLGEYVE